MPHDRANPTPPRQQPPRQQSLRQQLSQEVVGYLNFSSGTPDAKFLANLNQLWIQAEAELSRGTELAEGETPAIVSGWLLTRMAELEQAGGAFADCSQAAAVVRLVDEKFCGIYHDFHRDLLWHRQQHEVWNAFFYGRVAEAVLSQGPPWDDVERIIAAAREQLDDFVGYRPIPVLETEQRIEPYPHEWVRPVPLYIAGAGVAHGPYAAVLSRAIEILRQADPDLLRDAWFDLSHARRDCARSTGVRFRSSGEQAAQLPLRPVGPEPNRRQRILSPLRAATGDAGRAGLAHVRRRRGIGPMAVITTMSWCLKRPPCWRGRC